MNTCVTNESKHRLYRWSFAGVEPASLDIKSPMSCVDTAKKQNYIFLKD